MSRVLFSFISDGEPGTCIELVDVGEEDELEITLSLRGRALSLRLPVSTAEEFAAEIFAASGSSYSRRRKGAKPHDRVR